MLLKADGFVDRVRVRQVVKSVMKTLGASIVVPFGRRRLKFMALGIADRINEACDTRDHYYEQQQNKATNQGGEIYIGALEIKMYEKIPYRVEYIPGALEEMFHSRFGLNFNTVTNLSAVTRFRSMLEIQIRDIIQKSGVAKKYHPDVWIEVNIPKKEEMAYGMGPVNTQEIRIDIVLIFNNPWG